MSDPGGRCERGDRITVKAKAVSCKYKELHSLQQTAELQYAAPSADT